MKVQENSQLTQHIREQFPGRIAPHVDEEYRERMQESVPTSWTIWGVRVPQLRAEAQALKQEYKHLPAGTVEALLAAAFADQIREEVLCYLFWLAGRKADLTSALWPQIDRWVDEIGDWEICDQLAMGIAAPIVHQDLALVEELIAWTQSLNYWRRRFPVATAAALNHKGRVHVTETFRICTPLMTDTEPMVRKAVGWALREAGKHDPAGLYQFLLAHKDRASRTLLRESAAKLPDEQKEILLV